MLHIVSQASGNRSAADVPTLPPGAHRLARRTDGFWQGRAQQPAATVAQFAGHINLFPAIVRDDLSGADPEARPPRPSHLHIFVTPGAGSSKKKEKKKKGREGKIDGEMTSCASPSGLCFFNGHKLKLNLYGEEEEEEEEERGGNRIVKRQQYF